MDIFTGGMIYARFTPFLPGLHAFDEHQSGDFSWYNRGITALINLSIWFWSPSQGDQKWEFQVYMRLLSPSDSGETYETVGHACLSTRSLYFEREPDKERDIYSSGDVSKLLPPTRFKTMRWS